MLFSDVLGHNHLKNHLVTSAERGRIPHAQLFVGSYGSGILSTAIAYARYILCDINDSKKNEDIKACHAKLDSLSHPDLHFAFPVTTNSKIKKNPSCNLFMSEWMIFIKQNSYANVFDWYQYLGVDNKQGQIGVNEATDILKKLSLKSYEGGYKIMIIWGADKLNSAAANKLLKLIEEPPDKTLMILLAEEEEKLLQTIRSRCQVLHFPLLSDAIIAEGLIKNESSTRDIALQIARQAEGNYNKALHLLKNDGEDQAFEEWFISWVRSAFKAKGNKAAIHDLIKWSEGIAGSGREVQKRFLNYCTDFFRQALLLNYGAEELVFLTPNSKNFDLTKFAPFVHGANIINIVEELEKARLHIERNGNPKVIFTDLSIKLTRLLHTKESL
ncbi:DNA polymerase III subunit delta' [Gangjinia marincola]|uniref:DNA polymerase III subunit delta n=1 Tax=Gangjinia marincola TaxID=578463 RepID=A0ABP3XWK2_9FLAO